MAVYYSFHNSVMWELHSPFNEPARCDVVYQPSHPFPYLVTVTIGDGTESASNSAPNRTRWRKPRTLFDDYLIRGWTELIYCDSRLARALSLNAARSPSEVQESSVAWASPEPLRAGVNGQHATTRS